MRPTYEAPGWQVGAKQTPKYGNPYPMEPT